MGRGSAKGSSPKKGAGKAPASSRAAGKRTAKTAKPRRSSTAKPKSEAAQLASELKAAQARQAATADILKVIANSPADVRPVFESIVLTAARLLRCDSSFIMRCDGATYSAVAAATLDGLRPVLNPAPRPVDPAADFPSRAIATRKNLYLPDWSVIELPAFEHMVHKERGLNSALYLPMLRDEKCIGVLGLASRKANYFAEHDIALAESFRDQAVIAIENARLFQETQDSLARQTAMAHVLEVINSSPGDLKPVFDTILDKATQLCGASFGFLNINLGDDMHQNVATLGAPPEFVDMFRDPMYLGPETATGRLVRGESYVHTLDGADDEAYRLNPVRRALVDIGGARTHLAVPIRRDDVMLGSFTIYRREVRPFSPEMIALVQSFAAQAAIAIDNARLFNETRESLERQTATADILKVIASSPSDVQPVFDAIAESAKRLLGSHSAVVTRVIDDVVHFAAGTAENEAALHGVQGLLPYPLSSTRIHARVARTGELAANVDVDASDLPRNIKEFARAIGWRSMLVVPMLRNGIAIGTIGITRREAGSFDDKTIDLLQTFADQAVIAIENARLFNETQEALAHQTATSEVLQVIGSSMADTQPVFERILDSVERLFEVRQCSVFLARDGMLHLVARRGIGIESADRLFPVPMAQTRSGEVIRTGRQTYVPSAASPAGSPLMRRLAEVMGDYSVVMTPLVWEGQGIGIISAARAPNAVFSEKELALLRTFADQAVIAIENARLFNDVQARTRDLSESLQQQTATADVLKVISRSAFDLQTVLQTLVESAAKLCNANGGNIRIRDGDVLRAQAFTGASEDLKDFMRTHPIECDRRRIPGRAFLTGELVHVPDVLSDPEFEAAVEWARMWGYRALLAVPMVREGRVEGVFSLSRTEPLAFSDREIELVRTFVDQALIAIENVRLFNETQEALERQTATADILKVIASSPDDVQPVFEAIAASANRLIGGFLTAVIRFIDGMAHLAAFTPLNPEADAVLKASFPSPTANFQPFEFASRGAPTQIEDTEVFAQQPLLAISRARGFRSAVYAPLMNGSMPIGVIGVTRVSPGKFAPDHVQLLQTFADQAVIAIQNVRLFNETKEALAQQTATSEVLRVISSSVADTTPVFEKILDSCENLFATEQLGIFLVRPDGQVDVGAWRGAAFEAVAQTLPKPLDETATGVVVRNRAIMHMPNAAAMQDMPPTVRGLIEQIGDASMAWAPMLGEEHVVGSITVLRQPPNPFSEKELALLKTFADQAVIAIQNTRLFNETQEALERQTATADILKVIASSPDDVQPVFEAIAERSNRIVDGRATAVFSLVDDVAHLMALTPTSPEADAALRARFPLPLSEVVWGEAVRQGNLFRINDVEDVSFPQPAVRDLARLRGYRSLLFVPLLRDQKPIGAISVTRVAPGPFADHHVQLLKAFADQAVIAISNVGLFNEVQAKTEDLQESLQQQTATADVLKVISRSTFDLDAVLKTLTESAVGLCRAARGAVFLRDGDVLRVRASAGMSPEFIDFLAANPIEPARRTFTGRTFLSGEVTHMPDVLTDPEYDFGPAPQIGEFRSALCVPLSRQGRVEGVFSLSKPEPGGFSEREIDLIRTFADQAVIAIENVRLFNEVQARTADLQESLQQQTATADVLQVISASPGELEPVFDMMLASAMRLCEASHGAIWLREGDSFRSAALGGAWHGDFVERFRRGTVARAGSDAPMARAVVTGKATQVEDLTKTEAYRSGDPVPVAAADVAGIRTALGVPMLRDGESIGVFSLSRREVRPFTEKQIEFVANFAKQAVIAIQNAHLLNELRKRTTELSQSLDDLRAAQDRLVQTEKLASLGQLTAGIAHEIKNPLNFVNNFSALSSELTDELNDLLERAALTDKMREEVNDLTKLLKENLEKVEQHGKRADSIVKNMLLHSREGSGEQRPADINALVEESLNLAYHGARAEKSGFNITLQRDFDAGAGSAELFPQEVTRALLNLISNGFYAATKRKNENGQSEFEPTLLATTKSLGSSVEIRIRDNGTGIPPEVKEKMFNPFFTTKPAGEGTGLGLSMTHDIIVKQHGGRIDVTTEPGEFTEFTIVLPRTGTSQKAR